jgi:plasmid stability protein
MATLIVRQVDDGIVEELKERARKSGRSADAEHRLILKRALERKKGGGAELWKRLREGAPKLTDAEWETVDRAIQAARGRSATSSGHDDDEEAAGRTS